MNEEKPADNLLINCPQCQAELKVPADFIGSEFHCPSCDAVIELEEEQPDQHAGVGAATEPIPLIRPAPIRKRLSVPPKTEILSQPLPSAEDTTTRPCPKCGMQVHYVLKRCRHCGADMTGEAEPKSYGGINRLEFILGIIATSLLSVIAVGFGIKLQKPMLMTIGLPIAFVATLVLSGLRLRNAGLSAWQLFFWFVPVANLIVLFRCIICQEGYKDTEKLDVPGKVLFVLTVIVLLAVHGASIVLGVRCRAWEMAGFKIHRASEEEETVAAAPAVVTTQNWRSAIDASIMGYPGWFGSAEVGGLQISVATLDDASPAGAFWAGATTRNVCTSLVMVRLAQDAEPVTVNTAGAKTRFSNGSVKVFLDTTEVLTDMKQDSDAFLRAYAGPQQVKPGTDPYVTVLFVPRGFDWNVVVAVMVSIDGKNYTIVGRTRTVEEKKQLAGSQP